MKLSLREALGRLGQIRVTSPDLSGSPETVRLQLPSDISGVDTGAAIIVLHTLGGLTMLASKQVVEALWDAQALDVNLPSVPNVEKLNMSLRRAGVTLQLHSNPDRQENYRQREEARHSNEIAFWR